MNTNEFNRQISELQLERVKLERRLQHVQESINALIAMRRSADAIETLRDSKRLVCTGPELTAIKRMIELHDAQLDIVRINDLDAAIKLAKSKQAVAV